jgi:hypothetical protein
MSVIGYFQIHASGEIAIVGKAFWEANHGLDGDGLDEETESYLPDGFYSLAESVYEFDGATDPRQELIDAGFEERSDII